VQAREAAPREGQAKRGSKLGFWFFMLLVRTLGLRGAYGLLYFVCLHYLIFDRDMVASALPYIDRRFPSCGPIRRRLHVYRLFLSQGRQLIDRYAVVARPGIFEIRLKGEDTLVSLIQASEKGTMLVTSHQGNWQVAIADLGRMGRTVHLVMLPEENAAVRDTLYSGLDAGNIELISPLQYLGGAIAIMKALNDGDVVAMMGDRSYGPEVVDVSFLGGKAWFPYGAFGMAASAGRPVVVLNVTKLSMYCYEVDITHVLHPRYQGRGDRAAQLRPWVQEYVNITESFVEEHPYDCFLFRDVWDEQRATAPA
jgi:predicted LPLAT superfamily acyltransferase